MINVMQKLAQLDTVPRFCYEPAKKNPYFVEAVKYLTTYIDIFDRLTDYHTRAKLSERDGDDAQEKIPKDGDGG